MTLSLQAPPPLTMPGQFVLPATAATRAQVSIVPFTTTTTTNSMWCYWHLPQLTILTATTQLNRRALKESVSTSTRRFHCGNFNYKSSPSSAGRYRKENVTHSHCFIYSHSQHEHIEHFVHLRVHCSALLICCCCHWLATLLWGCFLCHHVFAVSLLTVRRRRGQCVMVWSGWLQWKGKVQWFWQQCGVMFASSSRGSVIWMHYQLNVKERGGKLL